MHFDSKSPVSFHSFVINFHPSEKTHPSLNPPCRSPCSFCSKLMTFSRSSMAFFPPTPGSLPSLSWLNEPPDDVTVAFAWCEKKQVQLVMYGFFFMVYCCSTWIDVDLFQNNFLCESVFHTLEENYYMVNSECWIHNNDRFCFETQHAQFLMLFTKHVFRTSPKSEIVALKFGVL